MKTSRMVKRVFTIVLFPFFFSMTSSASQNSIQGLWEVPQDGTLIEIDVRNGTAEGFVVKRPGNRSDEVDKFNPEIKLRTRPIIGLRVLEGLKQSSENDWSGGRIYDPDSGGTYRAQAALKGSETLAVRGFVAIPLLGRTLRLRRHSHGI